MGVQKHFGSLTVSVYSGKESYLGNLSLPCIQGVGGINV
jgi:hypothetical protein